MMNKNEFTKIARKILNSDKQLRSPEIMHPEREWAIGLLVAVLIFAGTALWSAQIYKSYQNTSVATGAESEEEVVYRELLVEAALQNFSERKQVFNSLVENTDYSVEETSQLPETPTETEEATSTATSTAEATPVENLIEANETESVATSTPEELPINDEAEAISQPEATTTFMEI